MTTIATALPSTHPIAAVDSLLRDRESVLVRIHRDVELPTFARTMLLTIVAGCAVFGAAIGFYRGGIQVAYAAIKLPLLMLLTAAVCTPVLTTLNAALDRPSDLRRDLALILSSLALGSLVLVAQAPIVLLAVSLNIGYHQLILLMVGCCAVAGIATLAMLRRGIRNASPQRAGTVAAAFLVIVAIVGAQMAWTLRPYAVRPRSPEVPFVRHLEGSLLDAVGQSINSARGEYSRDAAPLPGEPTGGN